MNFDWLKRYMPRGLYGRAALILLLPIVTLQLVVSVVFIQRYFEDVTRQMTKSLVLDIRLLQEEIDTSATILEATARLARLAGPLRVDITLPSFDLKTQDQRLFYDLSGRIVILTLHEQIDAITGVNLTENSRLVALWLETKHGPAKITLGRNRVSASNPHQFLVLVIFVSALMTLVAFMYLRNQLRPIKRLAHAAEAFGKGRVVDYRPAGAIEVRAAGRAFLDMRGRIERHIEQRTLMLSGVSHDLRTPLTRLKLGLSMVEGDVETKDMELDIADMEHLLDAFLTFARGDALDDLEEINPLELLGKIVDDTKRTGGDIVLGTVTGQGTAMLRPMAIRRALENLVGNALRYGRKAIVNIALTEKSLKIWIEDDGPGIPANQREVAVRPFARLDAARNQDQGSGVGLGLSIANDIAQRHGGILRLGESEDLGGLRVDLILPL